jgi:hypothetical protein
VSLQVSAQRGLLFHFTHLSNLPSILSQERLVSDTVTRATQCLETEAGDPLIKARRRELVVPVPPGGHPSDYVPFYFAPRSPMLYKINRGGVPSYQDGQQALVYVVTTVEAVVASGRPHVFSDGNCASAISRYHQDLNELATAVDWEIMNALIWRDTADDPDRMRRRMAEFLVHEYLPWSAVVGVGVQDEAASTAVLQALGSSTSLAVRVRPDWYY